MNERLREVAAQLTLGDIELLGDQARRPACRTVALEPVPGSHLVTLLIPGQRDGEAAPFSPLLACAV
jgi:hypothetical protein